jgi:holin-like protein
MRQYLPGLALCFALSLAGEALVRAFALPFAGPVLGLIVYGLWLARGRNTGWSRPGALLLTRWLGAFLVPILIGLSLHLGTLAGVWARLAALMLVTTLATGLVTALLFRRLARP